MVFGSAPDILEFLEQRLADSSSTRLDLATMMGTLACYNEGIHWWMGARYGAVRGTSGQFLPTDYRPESTALRVQDNVFTRDVVLSAAATYPDSLKIMGSPNDRDTGMDGVVQAQLYEDLGNTALDASSYLGPARKANFGRSLVGTWGLGFRIESGTVEVAHPLGEELAVDGVTPTLTPMTKRTVAFDFDPTRLILDPAVPDRDLRNHEVVIYHDVLTRQQIKAVLGLDIPDDQLRYIGQLTPIQQDLALNTNGRIFSKYRSLSRTKGAIYYQIHVKDLQGRFSKCYYVLELGSAQRRVLNFANAETPFGGDGLPFQLFYGHRRLDTIWGIGDGAMLKEGQDKRNLLLSFMYRIIQKHAGYQWIVDRRWMSSTRNKNDDDIRSQFTNQVGGVILSDGPQDRNVQAPTLVTTPTPQPFFLEMLRENDAAMRNSVFRSELNMGQTKSHVPDKTVQRALEESDRVHQIRMSEDITAHEQLLNVLVSTTVKHVQEASMATLGLLSRAGLDDEDFGMLLNADPKALPVTLTINKSLVRMESAESKQQRLMDLSQLPNTPLTGDDVRRQLADMDMPAMEEDRCVRDNVSKMVLRVEMGEEWRILPLGKYNDWAIQALRRAMFTAAKPSVARRDPGMFDRISRAIIAQTQAGIQEQLNSDPQVVMAREQQQAAMQQQAAQQGHEAQMQASQQAADAQSQPAEEANESPSDPIAQFIQQIAQQGTARRGQLQLAS